MATIGDSGAPSQNTINYDALLSTTLNGYALGGTMVDNIFKDSAFLGALRQFGGVTEQDGGERIAMPLMHEKNDTFKSYSGYGLIDVKPQDGMTTAFEEWAEIAGTITISRKEERQNSGEARLINLLEGKIKQAEMSMRETLNTQLIQGTVSGTEFVPGNGGLDLNPLGWFVRKDVTANPASGGNVGNISAAETWWRAKTAVLDSGTKDTGGAFAINVTTFAGLKVALRRMHNFCSRGSGGPPNLLVADQVTYETYENALDVNIRFQNTRLGELGFDSLKLRGAEMVWDEDVPDLDNGTVAITTGTCFFLNTNNYKLVIDSQTNVVTTPFVEPENQTAKTAKVLFMGNAACNNLRKVGAVYATLQTIAA